MCVCVLVCVPCGVYVMRALQVLSRVFERKTLSCIESTVLMSSLGVDWKRDEERGRGIEGEREG